METMNKFLIVEDPVPDQANYYMMGGGGEKPSKAFKTSDESKKVRS